MLVSFSKTKEIIHSSGKVRIDQLDDQGVFNREINSYTHQLFKVRRIFREKA